MTNVQIRNWQVSLIKDNHATTAPIGDGNMCINHLWLLFFCKVKLSFLDIFKYFHLNYISIIIIHI